jgi:DnaK suppressor protein
VEPSELAKLRAQLEAAREELISEGNVTFEPNRVDPNSVRRDDDAQPLNEMNQAIASKRNAERTARLRQIDAALNRMRSDPEDFGLCEACEEDISPRRLAVMPWAKFCIRCQEKRDPERGGRRSSLTDYD